jgi:hypothetical protein
MADQRLVVETRPAPVAAVEASVIVTPFGEARVSLRGMPEVRRNGSEHAPMPFVIPLETSVVGTQYETPFG